MDMVKFINTFSSTDILFIVIIMLSAVLAFLNGAIKEGLSLTKWILSALIAKNYLSILDRYVNIQPMVVKELVAFCLVFVLLSLCFQLINLGLNHFIKISGIGLLNKMLGMLFGACRGVILVSIISMIVPFFDHSYNIHQSKLYPILSPALGLIIQYKNII